MDELLMDRVKQLKDIEDRLGRMLEPNGWSSHYVYTEIGDLRNDIELMIGEAERQHAEF